MRPVLLRSLAAVALVSIAHAQGRPILGVLPDGAPVTSLAPPGTRALVLFFVASDCPISSRTFPEMKRLRERFSSDSVAFWFVYPNATERGATVMVHQQDFDRGGRALLDSAGTLTRMAGAEATPEVALFRRSASGFTRVYTGRIDDHFLRLGVERPQATAHFAERALEELLAGRPIDQPQGHPIGCAIVPPASHGAGAAP